MNLSNCPRVVGQLLAVAAVLGWLIADLVFDFRIEEWPSWVRIAAGVGAVGLLTILALRLTRGQRADGW